MNTASSGRPSLTETRSSSRDSWLANGSPWESRIPRCGSRSCSPLFAFSTKEYEDGTLGLIATLPVPRRRIVLEKTATMSLQAVPVCLVTMRCVLLGRGFDLTVP